jgi:hypothetical protein
MDRSANQQTGIVAAARPFGLPDTNDAASGETQADDRVSSVITAQAVVVPGVAREPARRRVNGRGDQVGPGTVLAQVVEASTSHRVSGSDEDRPVVTPDCGQVKLIQVHSRATVVAH